MPLPGSKPPEPEWQRVLARGFWRTVLQKGSLGWGIPFAALFAAIQQIAGHAPEFLPAMLNALPLGFVAGAAYGWAIWGYACIQSVKARLRQNEEDEES